MNKLLYTLLFSVCCWTTVHAGIVTVSKVSFEKDGTVSSFNIRLFNELTPVTVNNFLRYANSATVNGGTYNNSFFHRNAKNTAGTTGFVLQGGGFSFNEGLGAFAYEVGTDTYPEGLQRVVEDATIINEFGLSNLQGTIAMAKDPAVYKDSNGDVDISCTVASIDCILVDGTGPDSATSQWFINLKDSPFLDNQNGGFTVFGEVLPEDMSIVNQIAATETFDLSGLHPEFSTLPLSGYSVGNVVQDSNLVKISSIDELFKISNNIDFGDAGINSLTELTVTIETVNGKTLFIETIAQDSGLSEPFAIVDKTGCENITLVANSSCDITLSYSPVVIGDFSDEFSIKFGGGVATSYNFSVSASNAPDISIDLAGFRIENDNLETIGDFGILEVYNPNDGLPPQITLLLENKGVSNLEVFPIGIDLITAKGPEFLLTDNCSNKILVPDALCAIPVNFVSEEVGSFSFTITISSNDPDTPEIVVLFKATASYDLDGIAESVEDNAPNNGDGNFDDELDSFQSNVVSIKNVLGNYLTFVTTDAVNFYEASLTQISDFNVAYDGAREEDGVVAFEVRNLAPGTVLNVGFILPEGFSYDDFKLLSRNQITLTEEWSGSESSGEGGVVSVNNTIFTSKNGVENKRDLLFVNFVDGGFGDTDNLSDGVIRVTGLLLLEPKAAGGSSGMLEILFTVVFLVLIVIFRRLDKTRIICSVSHGIR